MFLIRQVTIDDAPALLKLAKLVHSYNLPPNPDAIRSRILCARDSFQGKIKDPSDRLYLFVLEDTDNGNVVGSSLIAPSVGTPEKPHLYFQVRKREFYSEDLQTGQVHTTLQLQADTTPHTEIGGLILSPAYRGHKARLGQLLSRTRFNYLAMHRDQFCKMVIAEMMAPLTPDSRNTLWQYLGRRFINLSYTEADRFCEHSKEFILSLFPKEEIYVSLLPPEARNLIGKVGKETEPARVMLERLGFSSNGHVDPFDGGPHLEATIDNIPLIKETFSATLANPVENLPLTGIISSQGNSGSPGSPGFRATRANYAQTEKTISLAPDTAAALHAKPGETLSITPTKIKNITPAEDQATNAPEKVGS